jgi:hypothetical protein
MGKKCGRTWSETFVYKAFSSDLREKYKEHKKTMLYAREKSLIPDTIPLFEARQKEKSIQKELTKLTNQNRKIQDQMLALNQILRDGIKIQKSEYLFKCPLEKCKGFVKRNYMCSSCEVVFCKECHCLLSKSTRSGDHKCKKEDVVNVKEIMNSTRPCPKCATRISKINGCDQIFCTNCHTAFSWNTGEIDTGPIHNPHYFELMRKKGAMRTPGDVPCGGLPQLRIYSLGLPFMKQNLPDVDGAFRRIAEVSHTLANIRLPTMENLRLRYLEGKISEKEFPEQILKIESEIEAWTELRQILQAFEAVGIDFVRDLNESLQELSKQIVKKSKSGPKPKRRGGKRRTITTVVDGKEKETEKIVERFVKNMKTIISFTNEALGELDKVYNIKTYKIELNVPYIGR